MQKKKKKEIGKNYGQEKNYDCMADFFNEGKHKILENLIILKLDIF
jgi:hypothetical protein